MIVFRWRRRAPHAGHRSRRFDLQMNHDIISKSATSPALSLNHIAWWRYLKLRPSLRFEDFWTRKRVSKRYQRCCCCWPCCGSCCYQIFNALRLFSFHNRSSLNFAHRCVTIFSTIAPCRIFKLSPIHSNASRSGGDSSSSSSSAAAAAAVIRQCPHVSHRTVYACVGRHLANRN